MPRKPLIAIDRRQRLAAATLLSAVDLPQPAAAVAQLWVSAAKICPGVTVGEIAVGSGRLAMLKAARDLVDEMIVEAA